MVVIRFFVWQGFLFALSLDFVAFAVDLVALTLSLVAFGLGFVALTYNLVALCHFSPIDICDSLTSLSVLSFVDITNHLNDYSPPLQNLSYSKSNIFRSDWLRLEVIHPHNKPR